MPIYVYETIENSGQPGRRFDVLQRISDPPLETDPKSGRPVRPVAPKIVSFIEYCLLCYQLVLDNSFAACSSTRLIVLGGCAPLNA